MTYSTSEIKAGLRDAFGSVMLMPPARFDSMIAAMRIGKPVCNKVRRRALAMAGRPNGRDQRRKAVLGLFGPISHRASWVTEFFGGTTTTGFRSQFDAAMRDDAIGEVLIVIDSPGGSVYGVEELASHIFASRGVKPIRAIADPLAASAAYWIGTAAETLHVTPSGEVGSIGVFAVHEDWSQSNAKIGIKPTYVHAGRFKVEGHPDAPLSADARAEIQSGVDAVYEKFIADVAKHRGVRKATALQKFGEGRMFNADKATKVGMADGVATFEQFIAGNRRSGMSVELRRERMQASQANRPVRPLAKPNRGNERWLTSFHEAGHLVVGLLLGLDMNGATIDAARGYVTWGESHGKHPDDFARMLLAGSCAEARFLGSDDPLAYVSDSDNGQLRKVYRGMHGRLEDNHGIGPLLEQADFQVSAMFGWIERTAAVLYRDGTISAAKANQLKVSK